MTRAEHLAWCKARAHAEYGYCKKYEPSRAFINAVTSMASDLGKHPETENMRNMAARLGMTIHD
jgi:pterin-4a-carbinolamine dehydratase